MSDKIGGLRRKMEKSANELESGFLQARISELEGDNEILRTKLHEYEVDTIPLLQLSLGDAEKKLAWVERLILRCAVRVDTNDPTRYLLVPEHELRALFGANAA